MNKQNRIRTSFAIISVMLASLVSTSSANAAESTLQDVLKRGYLLVGTGSGNAPWHFKDASGKLIGMDIDIAGMIAKGLFDDATKVKFIEQTPDSRIPNTLTNKVDITCQFMTVHGIRAQQVAFTKPYYREGVGLMMKKGSKYKTYADLRKAGAKVKVSILANVQATDYVHAALPNAKVLEFADPALSVAAVDAGRADAVAYDQSSIGWLISQFPGKYVDSGFGWMPQSYSCAMRPDDQVWINFVNQVLNEAMSGVEFEVYKASFKKWFGVTLPQPRIGMP